MLWRCLSETLPRNISEQSSWKTTDHDILEFFFNAAFKLSAQPFLSKHFPSHAIGFPHKICYVFSQKLFSLFANEAHDKCTKMLVINVKMPNYFLFLWLIFFLLIASVSLLACYPFMKFFYNEKFCEIFSFSWSTYVIIFVTFHLLCVQLEKAAKFSIFT